MGNRLDFEIDQEIETGSYTGHAGVPVLIEQFRVCGAAAIVDDAVKFKSRRRGLSPSQMAESLLALWAGGGESVDDLDRLREDRGLPLLLGYELPAAQTMRDFLAGFEAAASPPLLAVAEQDSEALAGLWRANRAVIAQLQKARACKTATIDIDATIIASSKRAAKPTYDGRVGYQPVVALWAEQDVILADEFRDGNVPAHSSNLALAGRALNALPEGVETVYLRADAALYDHALMVALDKRKVGFAISVPVTQSLAARMRNLAAAQWQPAGGDHDVTRFFAELDYLPDAALEQEEGVVKRLRYLGIRMVKRQGELFADGSSEKHFCIVTNRPDPEGQNAAALIDWQRGKAGTVEHCHDIMRNELAASSLPSQGFSANAAWFRLNAVLYNLLSAFKRIALSGEFERARPKRLRFLVLNTLGHVVRHARERLLRCATAFARSALDAFRVKIHALKPS